MNKELAKTLTVALVSYLDENRPEGTMDCSNGECISLEKAFTEENFDSVETLIKKKLTRLTEFEKRVRFIMDEFSAGRYSADNIDDVRGIAKGLLDIAKKDMPMPEDTIIFQNGVEEGRRLEREEMRLKFYGNTGPVPTVNGPLCIRFGGICSNPMRDCINCTMSYKDDLATTTTGTSTAKAEG